MSRLQFSISTARSPRPSRYESRLRQVAGHPPAPLAPPASRLLVRASGVLAIVAALAVALAIWRIYDFPH